MQATNNILLIRPSNFGFNNETAISNSFQKKVNGNESKLKKLVLAEFDAFVSVLKTKGINVFVFEDTNFPEKPDAVFPNNWISFHAEGTVIIYPMHAHNRRKERRQDIIEAIKKNFNITKLIDFSGYEKQNKYLEGTGSIVFDHKNKIAYASLSPRTDKGLFLKLCDQLSYKGICFYSFDKSGKEIYHSNVMMCIGENFAAICLAAINDEKEKEMVFNNLTASGHRVIDISFHQMENFAGNMLELKGGTKKNILALSQSAFNCLATSQKQQLAQSVELVPLAIPTIETIGGGSARCMIAEIFLPVL